MLPNNPVLVLRVAARHQRRADSIGDPHALLQKFEAIVQAFAKTEPHLPLLRHAQKLDEEYKAKGKELYWAAYHREITDPQIVQLALAYHNAVPSIIYEIKYSFERLQLIGRDLFYALLQQYVLPPNIRKAIEAAAAFYAKTRVVKPKKENVFDAYEKTLTVYRAQLQAAKDALTHGALRSSPGATETAPDVTLRAGPFTLVNTGGFDGKTMQQVAGVVEKAAQLMSEKGLGRVLYGEMHVSNTVSRANVLAFYLVQKDEMFIRANLKGKEGTAVRTVIHELGHRLHYKFLKGKDREIQGMYLRIGRAHSQGERDLREMVMKDPALKPTIGDTLKATNGDFTITGFDYGRGGFIVKVVSATDPKVTGKLSLDAYIRMKGIKAPPSEKASGYVTGYAAKNHDENFAEMIAEWCLGHLPKDQVEMLEAIVG